MALKVTNVSREFYPFLSSSEVPKKVLKDYDWLSDEEKEEGWVCVRLKNRKEYLHISDFMALPKGGDLAEEGWQGVHSDSFFSGTLIQMSPDGEGYKTGRYSE